MIANSEILKALDRVLETLTKMEGDIELLEREKRLAQEQNKDLRRRLRRVPIGPEPPEMIENDGKIRVDTDVVSLAWRG